MLQLKSEKEWNSFQNPQRRELFGLDPEKGNYISFLEKYFDKKIPMTEEVYTYYHCWWTRENSPLGQALK